MVEVLVSTWRKMSPEGRAAAQALALEDRAARLLDDAAQAAEAEARRPRSGRHRCLAQPRPGGLTSSPPGRRLR